MKKILAFTLCILLLMSTTVFADGYIDIKIESLKDAELIASYWYSFENHEIYIDGWDCLIKNYPESIIFPSTAIVSNVAGPDINATIAAIRDFPGSNTIKSLVFEYGIREIISSFNQCNNLQSIVLPQSVKHIEYSFPNGKPVTVYGRAGSYAETFAKQKNYKFMPTAAVKVNNKFISFDQQPVIENGRTLVPLRAIFEALGATVSWNDSIKTASSTRNGVSISLKIGSNQLYVNGVAKTLDVPAKLINDRTMVPARAVAEAFGCKVGWDDATKTVLINY